MSRNWAPPGSGNHLPDPDGDGIQNSVEMIVGGNPATGMDSALLPNIEIVSDPAGLPTGRYLLFTFRRSDLSAAAGIDPICEYSSDLTGPWARAVDDTAGVKILVDDNYGWIPPSANQADRVRVFIPCEFSSRLFGRLKATVPSPPSP